jgi:hypothetical protein
MGEARGCPVEIRVNYNKVFNAQTPGNIVNIDPTFNPPLTVEKRFLFFSYTTQEPASLERILAHELGHAFTGVRDVGTAGTGRLANIYANENPIVQELGEPPRVRY